MTRTKSTDNPLNLSVIDFAAATAAKTPTPGGGSVAGVVGTLGVALSEMTLNFTRGKKKFAEHEDYYAHLSGRLAHARSMFHDLVADDIQAYKLYQAAMKRDDGPDKDEALQLATAAAIDVPRTVQKLALALLGDLAELSDKCNPWLITDLLAGATLAVAAVKLSDFNVRVNVPGVSDRQAAAEVSQSSAADLVRAEAVLKEIEQAVGKHLA